ncbi:hypothetical protein ATB93_13085 [Sphingomonas sp. WG]|nr:hypothetical protein ATB93_13085 [Sphingomonas sp. WG]
MRKLYFGSVCGVGTLLLASMLFRCVLAAYQPRSPEVASTSTLVVASSAQARTLAPAVEAGRSTYQGQLQ